ncbi:MAG: alpha/beta fold hydrolase [Planctomycetaceae bacterium]
MSEPLSVAGDPGVDREYRTSDGRMLKYRHWMAEGGPRATVVAVHGIQSHPGWYGESSSALASAGIDVRFLDRRGSGLNREERGSAATASRLMDDVAEFAHMVVAGTQDIPSRPPLILLGVSWGARLAVAVCDRDPDLFDGLALLYPGLCTRVRPTIVQRGLLRLAKTLGGGRILIRVPLAPEQFTSVPRWQAFVRDDPLAIRRVTVSFLVAGEELARSSVRALRRLRLPRLVMLAGKDEIVDVDRTRELLLRIPADSLRVVEYPDARHTLEFEPDRKRFVAELIGWIESVGRRP